MSTHHKLTFCTWEQDGECSNGWSTTCNNAFILNDGGPVENSMKYCCFCGKKIKEITFDEQDKEQ